MIKVTRWSPDTCGCVLEYQWDDEVPAEERVHTISNVVQACSLHLAEPDTATHFTKVNTENTRKNVLLKDLRELTDLTELDESGQLVLKKNVVTWQFNEERVLEVTITGLTQGQKNNVQTAANSKFGVGKVIIL